VKIKRCVSVKTKLISLDGIKGDKFLKRCSKISLRITTVKEKHKDKNLEEFCKFKKVLP
jgi:hypothetical protein